jgi:hypothetical protein
MRDSSSEEEDEAQHATTIPVYYVRKRALWQREECQMPVTRVFTDDVLDIVDDLHNLQVDLQENERDEEMRYLLEKEVARVVEVTEIMFFTDEDEVFVFEQLRASAVDVEHAVFLLMGGCDCTTTTRLSMPRWRWSLYDDILDKAREIAAVRSVLEE